MHNFISKLSLIIGLVLFTKGVNAQNDNVYLDGGAVLLQIDGSNHSEKKLEGVIVALPDNSNQLVVRLNIPYSSIDGNTEDEVMAPFPDYPFHLKMEIEPWKIQESVTSAKTFETNGFLTLNHITKLVTVEYKPLPSLTDQDGGFNLNLIVGFNPGEFNLGVPNTDTRILIKIGDAPVNRL